MAVELVGSGVGRLVADDLVHELDAAEGFEFETLFLRAAEASAPRIGEVLVGGERQELGWAATFLASPYGRFISGHTLVVDGANWQRRSLTNPPVTSVRDQMGKEPFSLDGD